MAAQRPPLLVRRLDPPSEFLVCGVPVDFSSVNAAGTMKTADCRDERGTPPTQERVLRQLPCSGAVEGSCGSAPPSTTTSPLPLTALLTLRRL